MGDFYGILKVFIIDLFDEEDVGCYKCFMVVFNIMVCVFDDEVEELCMFIVIVDKDMEIRK